MSRGTQLELVVALAVAASLGAAADTSGQALPNPYRAVDGWQQLASERWAQLPDGRPMGAVGDLAMDPDGEHLWAIVRCDTNGTLDPSRFGNECLDSDLDPVIKFSMDGRVVDSFGGGLFIWPHGIDVDPEGNVWVTDAVAPDRTPPGTRGHQVIKFSPTGEALMTLGTPGVPGDGPTSFNRPADVVVADNGDIFVADGHAIGGVDGNNRIVKFSADGTFIKTWGEVGYGPGQFHEVHSIAIDVRGRVFVADRFNSRVQIFDQDGNFQAIWTQFGRPSGITFDDNDRIYVADSESDDVQNPGWEMGIRIGDAETGWVQEFIPNPWGDPRNTAGSGAEFVAVDPDGNLYGGEPRPRKLQKYVRVRK
jgi:sugar lactone lactonase YvrE